MFSILGVVVFHDQQATVNLGAAASPHQARSHRPFTAIDVVGHAVAVELERAVARAGRVAHPAFASRSRLFASSIKCTQSSCDVANSRHLNAVLVRVITIDKAPPIEAGRRI